jgi:flagellar assembly factor FliW
MPDVRINSTRFGEVAVPGDAIIEFPAGLIGLGGRRFALVATDAGGAFNWLQSVERPELALPVTDPWRFFADYEVELSEAEAARAGLEESEGVAVWVTVGAARDLSEFTANLRAPILVAGGRGHQVVNASATAPLRARLFPDPPAQQAA